MARASSLEKTIKGLQQLERFKRQAEKLANKAEKAGLGTAWVERFREDMGVGTVIEIESKPARRLPKSSAKKV
jgi:hypothetical protein